MKTVMITFLLMLFACGGMALGLLMGRKVMRGGCESARERCECKNTPVCYKTPEGNT